MSSQYSPEDDLRDKTEQAGQFDCKYSTTSDCTPAIGTCAICKEPFCEKHQSEADKECCTGCVSYQTLETKKEELVDEEGVKHEGARITPIGLTYRTLTSRISEMSDHQLEAHIEHVKKQVREAELVLDYRRIDLAASQVELEERGVAKRKNLRMKGVSQLASGGKVINAPQTPADAEKKKQLDAVAKRLKAVAALLNLPCNTPEELAKVALAVQKLGVKKSA